MLFDPKWNKQTLLDRWIAWLETQDQNAHYEWRYVEGCACGRFYGGGGWRQYPEFNLLNSIARGSTDRSSEADWTFGKCLQRARHYRDNLHLGWMVQ